MWQQFRVNLIDTGGFRDGHGSGPVVTAQHRDVLDSLLAQLPHHITAGRPHAVRKSDHPNHAAFVADNYNHLHEQPTIFYALALAAQLAGAADAANVGLAWAYVAVRVVHSLVQATKNVILLRFAVFALGSFVLMVLFVRTVIALP